MNDIIVIDHYGIKRGKGDHRHYFGDSCAVEESSQSYERFIDAWHRAEAGDLAQPEIHLNFGNLAMLMSVLTPRRLEVLKVLRRGGPLSVRALSNQLERDYKNVHTDIRALEEVGLVNRTAEGLFVAPWDVIDAHLNLVA